MTENVKSFVERVDFQLKHLPKVKPIGQKNDNRMVILTAQEYNKLMCDLATAYHEKYKIKVGGINNGLEEIAKEKFKAVKPVVESKMQEGKYVQYYKCPKCGRVMRYEWDKICMGCGQELDWEVD